MIVDFASFGWALGGHHLGSAYGLTSEVCGFVVLSAPGTKSKTGWWDAIHLGSSRSIWLDEIHRV